MRIVKREYEVYKFEELGEEAQEKAVKKRKLSRLENSGFMIDIIKSELLDKLYNLGFRGARLVFDLEYGYRGLSIVDGCFEVEGIKTLLRDKGMTELEIDLLEDLGALYKVKMRSSERNVSRNVSGMKIEVIIDDYIILKEDMKYSLKNEIYDCVSLDIFKTYKDRITDDARDFIKISDELVDKYVETIKDYIEEEVVVVLLDRAVEMWEDYLSEESVVRAFKEGEEEFLRDGSIFF